MSNTNKAEEILKSKGITPLTKHHDYDYLYCSVVDAMEEYRQSEIDELTKEVERLKVLNTSLFTLWENLYEAGEISISKSFSTSFNEIRKFIK